MWCRCSGKGCVVSDIIAMCGGTHVCVCVHVMAVSIPIVCVP